MLDKNQIETILIRQGFNVISVEPFSFSCKGTSINSQFSTALAGYFSSTTDVLFGILQYTPFINTSTAYDFSVVLTGLNSQIFSFTYKDAAGTYNFADYNEFNGVFVRGMSVTENGAYTNGSLQVSFVGYKIRIA